MALSCVAVTLSACGGNGTTSSEASLDDQSIQKIITLKNQLVTLLASKTDLISKTIRSHQVTHIGALQLFLKTDSLPSPIPTGATTASLHQTLRALADLTRTMTPKLNDDEVQRTFLLISASDAVQSTLVESL